MSHPTSQPAPNTFSTHGASSLPAHVGPVQPESHTHDPSNAHRPLLEQFSAMSHPTSQPAPNTFSTHGSSLPVVAWIDALKLSRIINRIACAFSTSSPPLMGQPALPVPSSVPQFSSCRRDEATEATVSYGAAFVGEAERGFQ